MTWFKVDDGFADHPKVIALQASKHWKGALALWTLAGSWSSRHLTDGHVPAAVVTRLGASKQEAEALVVAGLWITAEDGYRFHGWDERNPSRTTVEAKREAQRERVAKHREKRARNALQDANGNALQAVNVTPLVTPPPTRPDPTRPDLKPSPSEKVPSGAPAPSAPGDRIRELGARYPASLLDEVRAACALSRRSGRMADSVWLTTLERLDAHPADAVVRAMRVFVDRHADGDKGEAYLVAIARGEAKRSPGRTPPLRIDPAAAAESQRRALEIFGGPDDFGGEDFPEVANG